MIAAMVVMLQVATPAAAGPPLEEPPRRDQVRCPVQTEDHGDIIVCARPPGQDRYRLHQLTHEYDPVGGPGIGFRIGSGQGNVYAEGQQSPDGKPDKRIMVTVKFPF